MFARRARGSEMMKRWPDLVALLAPAEIGSRSRIFARPRAAC